MDIKYEVIITERAKQELKEIYEYISKSLMEENTADKLIDKIEKELLQLEDIPEGFSVIEKYRKKDFEYRRLPINNYVAIYRIDKEKREVYIIRIVYGVFDILKVDQKINWLQLKNGPLFLHNIQIHDRMYLEV